MLKVGDYAHWRGYGLVKIVKVEKYNDAMAGEQIRYKVKTGVAKKGFSFGIKTAYGHELNKMTHDEAKTYILKLIRSDLNTIKKTKINIGNIKIKKFY